MTDYFTPEKDITYTQADGCDVLLAAKGIPIPLATARAMGLIPAEDAPPTAPEPAAPTEPPTGGEDELPPDETATGAALVPPTVVTPPEPEPAEEAPSAARRKAKASEA